MSSWRDTAAPQTQQDLDMLLDAALGFAQQQLKKHGEFFPYAVVVQSDGEVAMVAAMPDTANDRPASADVITACRIALTERRDELRAAAVVADVRLLGGGDAVQVELEHIQGSALTVLLPYARKRFGRGIDFGELQAARGTKFVWPD